MDFTITRFQSMHGTIPKSSNCVISLNMILFLVPKYVLDKDPVHFCRQSVTPKVPKGYCNITFEKLLPSRCLN